MSTHNIGFYEDLTKKSLSIIIKYTPYLLFCNTDEKKKFLSTMMYLSLA